MRTWIATVAVAALVAGACGGGDGGETATATPGAGEQLEGLLRIAPGACEGEKATGSWFRMVQPGGTLAAGPFVTNGDSPCADKTTTPLKPGSAGGLRLGEHQPNPEPAFDAAGNAVAAAITEPTPWFAVRFGISTNEVDPQTKSPAPAPRVTVEGRVLRGDLRAWAAAWNGQHFNQGAPKPDGQRPGNTRDPVGAYDAASGEYSLEWSSQIVGGPFNNFTGVWHIEGKFEPAR